MAACAYVRLALLVAQFPRCLTRARTGRTMVVVLATWCRVRVFIGLREGMSGVRAGYYIMIGALGSSKGNVMDVVRLDSLLCSCSWIALLGFTALLILTPVLNRGLICLGCGTRAMT